MRRELLRFWLLVINVSRQWSPITSTSRAERVIRMLRRECFDHVIGRNKHHLWRRISEYIRFYNDDRPHQSMGPEPPNGPTAAGSGPSIAEPVLGMLHHAYRRAA